MRSREFKRGSEAKIDVKRIELYGEFYDKQVNKDLFKEDFQEYCRKSKEYVQRELRKLYEI